MAVRVFSLRVPPSFFGLLVAVALIGLSHNGLGVVGGDYANLVGLGGCRLECALHAILGVYPTDELMGCGSCLCLHAFSGAVLRLSADTDPDHPAYCLSHVLQSPQVWVGIFLGGIVTVIMMMYRIRGAIILGIFMVSIISWPRRSAITLFPYTTEGDIAYNYFKQVVGFYPLRKIGNAADYNYFNGRVWQALITFLYVDLFDTTGWVFSHLSPVSHLSSLPKAMMGSKLCAKVTLRFVLVIPDLSGKP